MGILKTSHCSTPYKRSPSSNAARTPATWGRWIHQCCTGAPTPWRASPRSSSAWRLLKSRWLCSQWRDPKHLTYLSYEGPSPSPSHSRWSSPMMWWITDDMTTWRCGSIPWANALGDERTTSTSKTSSVLVITTGDEEVVNLVRTTLFTWCPKKRLVCVSKRTVDSTGQVLTLTTDSLPMPTPTRSTVCTTRRRRGFYVFMGMKMTSALPAPLHRLNQRRKAFSWASLFHNQDNLGTNITLMSFLLAQGQSPNRRKDGKAKTVSFHRTGKEVWNLWSAS